MQTTLRINDEIYREAKVEAARTGVTLTQFIEEALVEKTKQHQTKGASEVEQRNQLMEALLHRTAHFRMGKKPTREEMNAR